MEEKQKFRVAVEYTNGSIGYFDYWSEDYAIASCEDFIPSIHRRICLMTRNDDGLYEIKRMVTA